LHLFFASFQNPELKVITKSKICTTRIKTQIPVTISNKESHIETRGVSHGGLAICIKRSISRQKKNYGNSNISLCKNIIFKKIL
jgi:hypothetical protein